MFFTDNKYIMPSEICSHTRRQSERSIMRQMTDVSSIDSCAKLFELFEDACYNEQCKDIEQSVTIYSIFKEKLASINKYKLKLKTLFQQEVTELKLALCKQDPWWIDNIEVSTKLSLAYETLSLADFDFACALSTNLCDDCQLLDLMPPGNNGLSALMQQVHSPDHVLISLLVPLLEHQHFNTCANMLDEKIRFKLLIISRYLLDESALTKYILADDRKLHDNLNLIEIDLKNYKLKIKMFETLYLSGVMNKTAVKGFLCGMCTDEIQEQTEVIF